MKTVRISLNSIDKVKSFVNDLTKFDTDFDLVSGSKPIDLNIHSESSVDEIVNILKPYIVD